MKKFLFSVIIGFIKKGLNNMTKTTKQFNLLDLLKTFSALGRTSNEGVTRRVYDSNWVAAQIKYADLAEKYGLNVFTDKVGNLYASTSNDPEQGTVIMTGSHMDTVVNGGKLDGTYGTLASLVSLGELVAEYGAPKVPIVAVSFSEEEGSRFETTFTGSKFLTNQFDDEVYNITDKENITFEDARKKALDELKSKIKMMHSKWKIAKYIELHIEQGPVLEKERIPIGIVTGITGQIRVLIQTHGVANHAGTTPMNMRDDAMRKAVSLMNDIYHELEKTSGLRYTIGKITATPNVANVVPDNVTFSLDMRHLDQLILNKVFDEISKLVERHDGKLTLTTNVKASKMNPYLKSVLETAAQNKNLEYKCLPSGAGHDAQVVSYKFPTGMIFVPSINGISHSPLEKTEAKDLINGRETLKDALYKLAY
ncbi:M20 family metallo-hydrolase [Liquorilactobacillus uvarum]|uniref:M20 family metallo-hydrolase n=2 Tax=Liquorilactobacillus uvarum TaxID=303240 RepID=UPI0028893579|nr:M20 family metallo-hydrolase [Liquorilactobacillus uvarum]